MQSLALRCSDCSSMRSIRKTRSTTALTQSPTMLSDFVKQQRLEDCLRPVDLASGNTELVPSNKCCAMGSSLPLQGRCINGAWRAEGHEGHVSQQQAGCIHVISYAEITALHLCSGAILIRPAPQVGRQLLPVSHAHILAKQRCCQSADSSLRQSATPNQSGGS